jgi:hypothetical protein
LQLRRIDGKYPRRLFKTVVGEQETSEREKRRDHLSMEESRVRALQIPVHNYLLFQKTKQSN